MTVRSTPSDDALQSLADERLIVQLLFSVNQSLDGRDLDRFLEASLAQRIQGSDEAAKEEKAE